MPEYVPAGAQLPQPSLGHDSYHSFLTSVPQATNETAIRELFIILASSAFHDSDFATSLALGAEYSVAFNNRGLVRRGRIDSFVDNVLVEFKKSLAGDASVEAARDQLAGYVAGAWAEDGHYKRPYLAVATDGLNWRVFSTTAKSLATPPQDRSVENVSLTEHERWPRIGEERNPDSFKRFLDRTFFRHTLLEPNASNFARDFGLTSPAFVNVGSELTRKARGLAEDPQMQLYESSWWSDLQVAYGSVENTGTLFVRHTYLALLARLLVWATLERRPAEPSDLQQVFDRSYFISKRIGNLVEDDYFAWHLMPSDIDLTNAWSALVSQLATYRLDEMAEDVLKPLYEELVDPETRHDLGEYYTPDWLATQVVDHLVEEWNPSARGIPRILDPACGSGSFLRASIHSVRRLLPTTYSPQQQLSAILASVHGMDVHPLAAIVAKATYLLSVADLVPSAVDIINLPVYLCNSLSGERPDRTMSLLGDLIELSVGREETLRTFPVPIEFVSDGAAYDHAIGEIIEISRSTGNSRTAARLAGPGIRNRLQDRLQNFPQPDVLMNSLAEMCVYLTELVKRKQDTIYGFLLRNRYRSVLLRDYFDLIVGNPPWLTVADIRAGDYRDLVLQRNAELEVAPRNAGDQAHTEIATVFMAQVATQFLRPRQDDTGTVLRLGFVLPRSIFSASHHRQLRDGSYSARFDVAEIWDLEQVQPLFNIPSCVLFIKLRESRPAQHKVGRVYRGRLPDRDPIPALARRRLSISESYFGLRHLGRRSAWGIVAEEQEVGEDGQSAATLASIVAARGFQPEYYARRFRQGAILYPQTLLVVEQSDESRLIHTGAVTVRTDPAAAAGAKLLKTLRWQQVVDAETLFYTAAAEHLVPFGVRDRLWTVVLPVLSGPYDDEFGPVDADQLRASGRVNTADWLENAETHWEAARKESEKTPLWQRLDHLSHLSAQAGRGRWMVLYTASGGRIVAGVLDTSALDRPFVARDKTYWCATDDEREAHYLCAFLNSEMANEMLSDFVTRGLLGKRDIHKRVLDLPWPEFNAANAEHTELAQLSRENFVDCIDSRAQLHPAVAQARRQMRTLLPADRIQRLEELVVGISSSDV